MSAMESWFTVGGVGVFAGERVIEAISGEAVIDGFDHAWSAAATDDRKRSRFRWFLNWLCSTWNASCGHGLKGEGDGGTGQLGVSSFETRHVARKEFDDAGCGDSSPACAIAAEGDEKDTEWLYPPGQASRCNERKRPSADECQR